MPAGEALTTPRLWLLPQTAEVVAARLAHEHAFRLTCPTPDGPAELGFPADWPGDPLPMFPALLEALQADPQASGGWFVVDRDMLRVVGSLGAKDAVEQGAEVEIGYGVVPAVEGRGVATEAVGALVAELWRARVAAVTAETAVGNVASQRVLQKDGFRQVGVSWDDEDGDLLLWRLDRPPTS